MTESSVLNRVRVKVGNRYFFGVHVPKTVGTVILDGKAKRVVQVEPKEMQHGRTTFGFIVGVALLIVGLFVLGWPLGLAVALFGVLVAVAV